MTLVNSPRAGRRSDLRMALALTFILTLVLVPLFGRRALLHNRLAGAIEKAPASTNGDPPPALQGEAALNQLKEQGLYGSLQEAVAAARYGFYQAPNQSDGWSVDNPAQRLRARFTTDGLQVETGGDGAQSHHLGMKMRSAGYGERQTATIAGPLTANGARAEIRRQLRPASINDPQSAITEWYHNTAAGLEQGFTIESAPGERRDGDWLRVALAIEGDLRAEAVDDGQALKFKDNSGRRSLRYDHLVVKDGRGRELKARMAAPEEGGEVWLEVDDREAVWPLTIDPTFTQQQRLIAPDAAADDWFGSSVAISGETAVVGAPGDDVAAGADHGSAYVFVRSGGAWTQQQKLIAPDPEAGVFFGDSVAISGETIVVSARDYDGEAGAGQGAAYVFVRSGAVWNQQQKLIAPDPAPDDHFGWSVAISEDTVVVGATGVDVWAGENQGAAYVFVRADGVWSPNTKMTANDAAARDYFGWSVAISGNTAVVGAWGKDGETGVNQGAAYVFERSPRGWRQRQKLAASDGTPDARFSQSVAINGETLVVGALYGGGAAGEYQGAVYVFARSDGVWTEQQKLLASDAEDYAFFGCSVAISGETIVVGAPNDDGAGGEDQGSAYVFARSGGVWSQQQKLVVPAGAAFDWFGASVAISGETIVVGAASESGAAGEAQGAAYVFITNTPPTIATTSMSRQQGVPASIGAIATVSDAENALNTLTVTINGAASATVNGVTVSSISVNASGQVTASVGAACKASNASFTLRVTDSMGLFSEATLNVTVIPETTPPVLICPSNIVVTLPPNTMDTGMVVNYPAPTATDNCTASPIITTSIASGSVFPVGVSTVNATATDAANNQSRCGFTVTVLYNFSGFFPPIDNPPSFNLVNAGSPVKFNFSLSGNKGLNIFGPLSPLSQQISCNSNAPMNDVKQTAPVGGGNLSYDAATDTYTYVWQTDSSWARTCRKLIVRLNDRSEHVALFQFK